MPKPTKVRILEYLYTVSSIPRKQLKLAFQDVAYNTVFRATKELLDSGYIELLSVSKGPTRIKITKAGMDLFFVLLAQYGVPVLFLLLCAHIIYKQTEKKREKEQSKTDTQAESKEEKYLTQINAVVGTKAIFSEQTDQMRYQVRRFGQKMATAYSMTQDSKTSGEQAKCLILLASAEKIFYDRLDDAIRSASMFDENEYKAFCKGTISFGDKETAQKKKEIYSGIIDTINKVIHDNERLILRLDSLAYALNQRSAQNPWDTDVVLAMSKLDSVISKTANDIKQDEEISKEVMRRFDALK